MTEHQMGIPIKKIKFKSDEDYKNYIKACMGNKLASNLNEK